MLRFSIRAAQCYMAIADCTHFQKSTIGRVLPSSWRTLSVLQRLDVATFEAVFQVGRELLQAKQALPHGEFQRMVERELPFSASTARRYMEIASAKHLQNVRIAHTLPSSWYTLSVLQRLDVATFEAVFQVGRELLAAKQALPHGEFQKMVERELPFSDRTARRYMAIASAKTFQNGRNASVLPSSWYTLFVLQRLDLSTFEAVVFYSSSAVLYGHCFGREFPKAKHCFAFTFLVVHALSAPASRRGHLGGGVSGGARVAPGKASPAAWGISKDGGA